MTEKLKSRKFQVWIVWSLLAIACIFVPTLPKETIFTYYGLISMIYIGGNVASSYIESKKVV